MFILAEFQTEKGTLVAMIPSNWAVGDNQCLWPDGKASESWIRKKKEPEPTWLTYPMKVLYSNENFDKVKSKEKKALIESDIATDSCASGGRGKRTKFQKRLTSCSSIEESDGESMSKVVSFNTPSPPSKAFSASTPKSSRNGARQELFKNHGGSNTRSPSIRWQNDGTSSHSRDHHDSPYHNDLASSSHTHRPHHASTSMSHHTAPTSRSHQPHHAASTSRNHQPHHPSTAFTHYRHTASTSRSHQPHYASTSSHHPHAPSTSRSHQPPASSFLHTPFRADSRPPQFIPASQGITEMDAACMERMFSILEDTRKFSSDVMDAVCSLQRQVSELQRALQGKDCQEQMPEGIDFPLTSLQQLLELENRLTEQDTRHKLVKFFAGCGGESCTDGTRRILRKCFSNDLALQYNYTGTRGKLSFKELKLKSVVFAAVRQLWSAATEKEFDHTVGTWLTSARDRDGGRKRRMVEAAEREVLNREVLNRP